MSNAFEYAPMAAKAEMKRQQLLERKGAVGDGAQVVANLHEHLATLDGGQVRPLESFRSLG